MHGRNTMRRLRLARVSCLTGTLFFISSVIFLSYSEHGGSTGNYPQTDHGYKEKGLLPLQSRREKRGQRSGRLTFADLRNAQKKLAIGELPNAWKTLAIGDLHSVPKKPTIGDLESASKKLAIEDLHKLPKKLTIAQLRNTDNLAINISYSAPWPIFNKLSGRLPDVIDESVRHSEIPHDLFDLADDDADTRFDIVSIEEDDTGIETLY